MRKNMEGNKQWKRVPFTIELAKNIQSGKVEGRIVTSEDLLVRIVDFNFKDKTDSIVYIGTYANGEQEFIQTCNNEGTSFGVNVLFIELPEETPKLDDSFNKKLHDTAEVLATPKHDFKIGDKVYVSLNKDEIPSNEKWLWNLYNGCIGKVIRFDGELVRVRFDNLKDAGFYPNQLKHFPKHGFKPFDKVLVRDNSEDKWVPDIFRYYDDNYPKDYPYRCCANDYKQCIPYAGNEHLVGTTDNPKEK